MNLFKWLSIVCVHVCVRVSSEAVHYMIWKAEMLQLLHIFYINPQ